MFETWNDEVRRALRKMDILNCPQIDSKSNFLISDDDMKFSKDGTYRLTRDRNVTFTIFHAGEVYILFLYRHNYVR